ncbi:ATP-binding protein [Microbacterium sp. SLBN-111]|uniref:ATP-binding protein n=1 Tax=Microbacterium sp. SLBN-111 TaxID=3377733 RepID=UPI003C76288B
MPDRSDDERYLDGFLDQDERRDLEYKKAEYSFGTDKALSYCAGIANSGGGYLVLGVTNDRVVHGTAAFPDPRGLELRVHEKLSLSVVVRELTYDGKRVLVLQIPPRRRGTPVAFDGRYYLRVGESLVDMTAHQLGEIFDELRERPGTAAVRDHLSAADVHALLHVEKYFELLDLPQPTDPESSLSILESKNLVRRDQNSGFYAITATGALFIARDLAALGMEWRRVRLIRYAGTDRVHAVFEHLESRGYGICFEELLDLVRAHVPVVEVIADGRRRVEPIYPGTALREFIANALVHQDLDERGVQITIELFEDRIEIRNPGRPLIDVKRFVDDTRARNPELAEILRLARICEIRGSGVDRALLAIENLFAQLQTSTPATARPPSSYTRNDASTR